MTPFLHDHEIMKGMIDAVSVVALVGWFVGTLPAIATALTILWTGLRIYEMDTVQRWFSALRRPKPPDDPAI